MIISGIQHCYHQEQQHSWRTLNMENRTKTESHRAQKILQLIWVAQYRMLAIIQTESETTSPQELILVATRW